MSAQVTEANQSPACTAFHIGTRLTLDNVVSNVDHVMATHIHTI
jgi:hypothetical protein